jgi:branched-chain amino acid aminotransferase
MSKTPNITGEKIWLDGQFVDWADAKIHILTHTLHYGLGVFEGIRCYRTADGRSAVFRLADHIRRLFDSARINLMQIPFGQKEIEEASLETLRRNQLEEGYIRPLAFIGEGAMGLNPGSNAIRVAVIAWPWGSYLGEDGMRNGIRARISSFSRHHVNAKGWSPKRVARMSSSFATVSCRRPRCIRSSMGSPARRFANWRDVATYGSKSG